MVAVRFQRGASAARASSRSCRQRPLQLPESGAIMDPFPPSKALLVEHPNVMPAFGVMAERPSFAATLPPTP